jgi:hypothetical protein
MRGAEPGRVVSIAGRRPPYIVVDRDLPSIGVSWPGRLWRVRVIEAASRWEQPSARYTRAVSVLVEAEEDAARLFGDFGSHVVQLLDTAHRMDRAMAEALAAGLHPEAAAACDRAWRRWLDRLGVAHGLYEDLSGTLKLGGPVNDSPIKGGLLVLYDTVFKRALALAGDQATDRDEEDMWLVPPWSDACTALTDAALALGAPDIVEPEDRAVLLAGWHRIAG